MVTAGPASPELATPVATRAALLRAAMRRFTVLGYERTTTRDIAADAGVNVSLIAHYFGSKEGLFAAVVEQTADAVGDAERAVEGDVIDNLVAGLSADAWPEFGGEHPLLLLVRDAGDDENVHSLRRRAVDSAVSVLADKISQGDGDPDAAEAVLAVLIGVLTVRATRPHGRLAQSNESELRELFRRLTAALDAT